MKHLVYLDKLKLLISDCKTFWELSRRSRVGKLRLQKLINTHNIDISHFTPGKGKSTRSIQRLEERHCLQCNKKYFADKKYNQKTCSRSCANKFFRSGINHGNYIDNGKRKNPIYRRICFKFHQKKCICCDETVAVDVHHIDYNCNNNKIDNLVPLCANHHRYLQLKEYRHIVEEKIKNFIEIWRNGKLSSL